MTDNENLLRMLVEAAKSDEAGTFDMEDGNTYRVTVEAIAPEPAVAEKRWECRWGDYGGYHFGTTSDEAGDGTVHVRGDAVAAASLVIASATPPTFPEFRDAVMAATGVILPEQEEPKLWVWDVGDDEWSVHEDSTHPPYAEVTTCGPNGTVASLYVTATTETRDELRDEALAWAAKAAGKGAGA